MKKIYAFVLAAMTIIACNPDNEVKKDGGDDTPKDTAPEMKTTDATTVCINEVCGVSGYKGIELYNPTDAEISLEDFTIVKNKEAEPCWTAATGDKIAAKGFFLIKGKKECDNIKDLAQGTSTASFSPTKSLLLELKNASGTVIDTFDRGWAVNGKEADPDNELTLATLTTSVGRKEDGKAVWKLLSMTMGKTNAGAEDSGNVPVAIVPAE